MMDTIIHTEEEEAITRIEAESTVEEATEVVAEEEELILSWLINSKMDMRTIRRIFNPSQGKIRRKTMPLIKKHTSIEKLAPKARSRRMRSH